MTARAEVVREARRWLGVRWAHQGRSRDGLDCVGLLIVVGRALELLPAAHIDAIERASAGYSRYPRGQHLRELLRDELAEIDPTTAAAGDVMLFAIERDPQHLGLLGEHPLGGLSLIHAMAAQPRRVVETIFDETWRRRLVAAFALPGVA